MAVIYSKLGGCFGETAKLGPLARTDLCAWVKGLLDKLITHLGSGSSLEEPWGLLCLLLLEQYALAPWELGPLVTWEALAWETSLSACEIELSAWEALSLAECLTLVLPAWEVPAWETSLYAWEIVLSAWEALETLSLPAWELMLLFWEALAWGKSLSDWEIVLSAWEAWEALSLVEHLNAGVAWEALTWEAMLSAWERVLSSREVWEALCLPEYLLMFPSKELLSSLGGLLWGGTALASWEAELSWRIGGTACLWITCCLRRGSSGWGGLPAHLWITCHLRGPSGEGALPSYITFLFVKLIVKLP